MSVLVCNLPIRDHVTITWTSYAPAEMYCAWVKTMHIVLVCTQVFTQLTLNRTVVSITFMQGMINVASNVHKQTISSWEKESHIPGQEYLLPSTNEMLNRLHGYCYNFFPFPCILPSLHSTIPYFCFASSHEETDHYLLIFPSYSSPLIILL